MASIGSFESLLHSQASQRVKANNSLEQPQNGDGAEVETKVLLQQPSIIAINSVT